MRTAHGRLAFILLAEHVYWLVVVVAVHVLLPYTCRQWIRLVHIYTYKRMHVYLCTMLVDT